jgi:hypothetical protein
MPQETQTGPYRDPVDNLANDMLTNAGKTGKSSPPDKELDDKINKFNAKTDTGLVNLIKGKPPVVPHPAAPKPPPMAYMKTSDYAQAREARKKL